LERLERERRDRERGKPQRRVWPWKVGENPPAFELYVWSAVERRMFGALAYPPTSPRPAYQEEQIAMVVGRLKAADDLAAAFRDWVQAVGCDATDA
jgi:hypothetical protein